MHDVEVAIVGAGATGAAAAWRLGAAGAEVLLLERFEPGHGAGSSHGPTRIFRFAYEDPFYVAMARRALPMWRDLETEAGEHLLDITGGVDIGPPSALEAVERALAAGGASSRRVEGSFGGVPLDRPALYSPDTGVLAASASVLAMVARAGASGATVRTGVAARIESFDADGVTILAGDERLRARRCVLAAGAWTAPMLALAGAPVPDLRVSREQVAYFPQREDFPVLIDRGDTLRFAVPQRFGAPGARAGEHGTGAPTTADERDFEPDLEAARRVAAWARAALPGVVPAPIATETCLYTSTADEDFVIDRLGALVVASPCSGHGFKFAPLVGEVLARLALDRDPQLDLSRFALDRRRADAPGSR